MFAAQARKDGKERVVPDYCQEQAEAWLRGLASEHHLLLRWLWCLSGAIREEV